MNDERGEPTVMSDECGMMSGKTVLHGPLIFSIARSSLLRFKCALVITPHSSLLSVYRP
ncbi:MAG: hypothetical protein K2X06_16510 [Burkholderiales bacterium]|nr:hypothetical protein [Burkholderiales bacterium]